MELLYLDKVDSTNKYAKEEINNIDDMTVVYTYNQTAGRGRLARKWSYMGSGNIYASIVLKPSEQMKEVYSNLTQLLCVVLAQTFEEYRVTPKIKWPNDIQINGKKISGILAESVIEYNKLKGIVLGFGVNLNVKPEMLDRIDQPATSLNIEAGHAIERDEFLDQVMKKFCLLYNRFIEGGFLLIKEDYIKRAGFINKKINVKVFDKIKEGIATGITDNGALILKDKNNIEHILMIGDIL